MADFRKWLYAFAVVALLAGLTVPASAQSSIVSCIVSASNPTVARAEGYAELMGDLTMSCTGGTPTLAGSPVPPINIQIFLSQNVTSKITATLSSGTFLESLLIFDEPNSTSNPNKPIRNCGASGEDTTQAGPGVCTIISSDGTGFSTYSGASGHPNVFQGRLGTVQNSGFPSSIVFSGVPFDPPGTGSRFIRITNVRANANGAGIAQANQTSQIFEQIGVQNTTQGIQITQPQVTVAFVQRGLTTSIQKANTTFAQCLSEAPGLPTDSPTPNFFATTDACDDCAGSGQSKNSSTVPSGNTPNASSTKTPTVRFTEGFNSSWKVKNVSFYTTNGTFSGAATNNIYTYNGGATYPSDLNQNVPGVNYNSESGYVNNSGLANPSPNPPAGYGNGVVVNTGSNGSVPFSDSQGTGIASAGIASQGTRLAMALANMPTGASAWVPPVIYLFRTGVNYVSTVNQTVNNANGPANPLNTATPTPQIQASGVMVLTNTDSAGNGSFSPPTGSFGTGSTVSTSVMPLQQINTTNGAGLVVYEILFEDPSSIEYADVPVVVSYSLNLPQNLPQPGVIATAAMGFAPFYSTSAATQPSGSLPHPRFQFTGTAANLFGIVKCSCNLLFPYVTQAAGYDTGIAIANTTADPYGTANQLGTLEMWYYGTLANGGAAPSPQCTNVASPGTCPGTTTIPAGQVMTYTLFNGSTQWGLDNRGAGFTGYMITQAQFQLCHGFAFISALGAGPTSAGLSEGYVALVLDGFGGGARSQNTVGPSSTGESLGH